METFTKPSAISSNKTAWSVSILLYCVTLYTLLFSPKQYLHKATQLSVLWSFATRLSNQGVLRRGCQFLCPRGLPEIRPWRRWQTSLVTATWGARAQPTLCTSTCTRSSTVCLFVYDTDVLYCHRCRSLTGLMSQGFYVASLCFCICSLAFAFPHGTPTRYDSTL